MYNQFNNRNHNISIIQNVSYVVTIIEVIFIQLNKVQWKICLKYHTVAYNCRIMTLRQYLRRLRIKNFKIKSKSAIPSCSRCLEKVICKLRLNWWNTKYSQNVTCVCKNILSVKHTLLECPITTELFQKKMDMT